MRRLFGALVLGAGLVLSSAAGGAAAGASKPPPTGGNALATYGGNGARSVGQNRPAGQTRRSGSLSS